MKKSMSKVSKALVTILISLVLLVTACTSADPALVRAVTNDVMCPCGSCTLALVDCHCPTAEEITIVIEKSVSRGLSKEEILRSLVNRYGKQVLASQSNS